MFGAPGRGELYVSLQTNPSAQYSAIAIVDAATNSVAGVFRCPQQAGALAFGSGNLLYIDSGLEVSIVSPKLKKTLGTLSFNFDLSYNPPFSLAVAGGNIFWRI